MAAGIVGFVIGGLLFGVLGILFGFRIALS